MTETEDDLSLNRFSFHGGPAAPNRIMRILGRANIPRPFGIPAAREKFIRFSLKTADGLYRKVQDTREGVFV